MLNSGYKDAYLGSLPTDWKVVPLQEAIKYEKSSINPQDFPDETFDYYSIPAYAEHGKPILERGAAIHSQKLVVKPGMILFGKLNPRVPKVWHVVSNSERRKIASTEFIPLIHLDGISFDQYIYYLAWSEFLLPKSQELVSGSTPSRQRVDVRAFLNVPIPLPPLPEQRAIAHVLSTVREAIEATEHVIAAARELKRSLMKHLFTYGPVAINQTNQLLLKDEELWEIPKAWSMIQLRKLLKLTSGKTRPKDLSGQPTGEAVFPVYGGNGVMGYSSKYLIENPTIVLGRVGEYCGAVHFSQPKSWISDNALYVKQFLRCDFDMDYLIYALEVLNLNRFKKKSGQPLITQSIVLEKELPFPPLSTQKAIAKTLERAERKISAEIRRKNALKVLFDSMLHQLMTGTVRLTLAV